MGEGGAIGSPSCVANAINDALSAFGRSATDFPFGPSQLMDVLSG
jgi:CO/xanthine dehydrogenase Mo-binding subunit